VKILIELLSTISLAIQQARQGRFSESPPFQVRYIVIERDAGKLGKKLLGENDAEVVLQRLDRLTQEEARMTTAQTLEIASRSVDKSQYRTESTPQGNYRMVHTREHFSRMEIEGLTFMDPWETYVSYISFRSRHSDEDLDRQRAPERAFFRMCPLYFSHPKSFISCLAPQLLKTSR
jgi:hypothetical protein